MRCMAGPKAIIIIMTFAATRQSEGQDHEAWWLAAWHGERASVDKRTLELNARQEWGNQA